MEVRVRQLARLCEQNLQGAKKARVKVREAVHGLLEEMRDGIVMGGELFFTALSAELTRELRAAIPADPE